MAGVSDIVVFGFGSWSSIDKLPTLGFSIPIGDSSVTTLEFVIGSSVMDWKIQSAMEAKVVGSFIEWGIQK